MPSFRVLTLEDSEEWRAKLNDIKTFAPAHLPEYCGVFERNGDGQAECVVYNEGQSEILFPYIRRNFSALPFDVNNYRTFSDLVTPYGYGGPLISAPKGGDIKKLCANFYNYFSDYANSKGIVSIFIRFNPLLQNHNHFLGILDHLRIISNNVIINIDVDETKLLRQYRQSYRNGIRQAQRAGLVFRCVDPVKNSSQFYNIYDETMRRKATAGYWRFSEEFFEDLTISLPSNLVMFQVIYESIIVAAALFLTSGSVIDYFLAGNSRAEGFQYASHLLIFEACKWARQRGFRTLHMGGGDESLFFFKSGFSDEVCAYPVGKHVFDLGAYEEVTALSQKGEQVSEPSPQSYFPAYRAYELRQTTYAKPTKNSFFNDSI